MAKAKLTTHKGAVQDLFAGCHVSLFTTQPNEITAAIVADKVRLEAKSSFCSSFIAFIVSYKRVM